MTDDCQQETDCGVPVRTGYTPQANVPEESTQEQREAGLLCCLGNVTSQWGQMLEDGKNPETEDWETTQGRCVLQTACHSAAAPPCSLCPDWATEGRGQQYPKRLSEAQTTLWKWPGEKHGVQFKAGQGCYPFK